MKTRKEVMKEYEKEHESSAGLEFIRAAVRFFDNRNEWSNDNKTPLQLLNDAYKFYALNNEDEEFNMLNESEP